MLLPFLRLLREFIGQALCGHFTFELRECEQQIEKGSAHGSGRIQFLCRGNEFDAILLADLPKIIKVPDGSSQTV